MYGTFWYINTILKLDIISRILVLNKTWILLYWRKCQSDILDAVLGVTVIHLVYKLFKVLLIFDQKWDLVMSKSYLNISVQLLQTECESGVLYYQDSWWSSKRRGDDCGHSQFYC